MNSDIHFLWPTDLSRRDILHEYFVPPSRFDDFLVALRAALRKHGQELLNVTVRDLRKDDDSLLAYARFFAREAADEARMVAVDRLGFKLHLRQAERRWSTRIAFPREVTTAADSRTVLIDMARQARPA